MSSIELQVFKALKNVRFHCLSNILSLISLCVTDCATVEQVRGLREVSHLQTFLSPWAQGQTPEWLFASPGSWSFCCFWFRLVFFFIQILSSLKKADFLRFWKNWNFQSRDDFDEFQLRSSSKKSSAATKTGWKDILVKIVLVSLGSKLSSCTPTLQDVQALGDVHS